MNEVKKPYKYVGTNPIRPDGVPKVTGLAKFGNDYRLPGTLYGKILRSPHAHARIKSDRKSTRLNSSHSQQSRMPSSA